MIATKYRLNLQMRKKTSYTNMNPPILVPKEENSSRIPINSISPSWKYEVRHSTPNNFPSKASMSMSGTAMNEVKQIQKKEGIKFVNDLNRDIIPFYKN
jgi:hypothetical protein